MKTQPANELRRRLGAFCLFAAPLLMLAGDALRIGAGAERAWLITFKLSFALFVGAALAIVSMTSERADRAGLVGGALAVVGCLAGSGILTATAVMSSFEAAALGEAAQRAVEVSMTNRGVGEYVILYPLPGLAFPAGFLVLSYALRRARVVGPAAAAALALGALLFPVGRIGRVDAAVLASGAAMSLGMALVGWRLLRGGKEELARREAPAADLKFQI